MSNHEGKKLPLVEWQMVIVKHLKGGHQNQVVKDNQSPQIFHISLR